jgi:hypothetical protein
MGSKIKIVRSEIYRCVWEKPAREVAQELGMSGVMLKRICKQLNVPTPSSAYWAKLEAGKAVSRTPLPSEGSRHVVISDPAAHRYRGAPPPELAHRLRKIKEEEKSFLPPIVTYSEGQLRTACVRAIADRLAFQKANSSTDAVSTSRQRRHRALCIADALVEAMRLRGFKAREMNGRLVLSRGSFEINIRLTDAESSRGQPTSSRGSLGLRLILRQTRGGVRTYARDEAGRTVDEQLGRIVLAIRRAEAASSYEAERAAAEARRLAAKLDLEKVSELWAEVDTWFRVQQCRSYLDQIEARLAATGVLIDPGSSAAEWLHWARGVCDNHDPVTTRTTQLSILVSSQEKQ